MRQASKANGSKPHWIGSQRCLKTSCLAPDLGQGQACRWEQPQHSCGTLRIFFLSTEERATCLYITAWREIVQLTLTLLSFSLYSWRYKNLPHLIENRQVKQPMATLRDMNSQYIWMKELRGHNQTQIFCNCCK